MASLTPNCSRRARGAQLTPVRCSREARAAGFTYIGLLILIAIIALASVATLSTGSILDRRAKEEELLFIGAEFARAFRSYHDATPVGQRNYPSKLEELLKDPRYPGVRRHLRRIYVDPMTGRSEWGLVAVSGGIVGVHSLATEAPIKIAEFTPEFAALTGKTSYRAWAFGFLPPGVPPPPNVSLAGTLYVPTAAPSAGGALAAGAEPARPAPPPSGTAATGTPPPFQLR